MKKSISLILLIAALSFSLIGCASEQAPPDAGAEAMNEPITKNVVPLDYYEANIEYEYDLDGDQTSEKFQIETDNMNYYNLIIDEEKYSLDSLSPDLVFFRYKLTQFDDNDQFAITVFVASPPNEEEVHFYEYDSNSSLKQTGAITSASNDLFDREINYLSHERVDFDGTSFSF